MNLFIKLELILIKFLNSKVHKCHELKISFCQMFRESQRVTVQEVVTGSLRSLRTQSLHGLSCFSHDVDIFRSQEILRMDKLHSFTLEDEVEHLTE